MPKICPEITYIGIDPGKNGGIAGLCGRAVWAVKMPETPSDVFCLFRDEDKKGLCFAAAELVSGYAGEGQPGSAMFNFGRGVGHLEMALLACGISSFVVPPRTWQKAAGIAPRKKTETKTAWKNRIKAVAQRLFPAEKVTLATADALLIALYCKRKHEGTLG